jgi:hypothetical protein
VATFIALYRGSRLAAVELVAVSTDPGLVAHVAGKILAARQGEGEPMTDPATMALTTGKIHALELVRDEAEAQSSRGPHRAARTPHRMAPERFGTVLPKAFCARKGCGQPLPSTPRHRGSERKYCSSRCRASDWRTRQRSGPRSDSSS